ncbi:MAG: type II toxin-antitoxin system mRNA interferase toxin, RelE/StbE family [Acidobacteria bacterium]|nr:MAG: type II toxin-antitoxin system mRNA interferase toxin, RelE/StbE family [Acidobacteriota bacterium]
MAWRVKWTELAWNGVESAAEYIARDSPRYAAALMREARDASRSLRRFAKRGRIVPEENDPNIRELFIQSYRLIYRLRGNEVEIINFIHGARDLGAIVRKR